MSTPIKMLHDRLLVEVDEEAGVEMEADRDPVPGHGRNVAQRAVFVAHRGDRLRLGAALGVIRLAAVVDHLQPLAQRRVAADHLARGPHQHVGRLQRLDAADEQQHLRLGVEPERREQAAREAREATTTSGREHSADHESESESTGAGAVPLTPSEALRMKSDNLQAIEVLSARFGGRIVDVSEHSVIVEMCGKTKRVEAFLTLLKPFGVLESARTGRSPVTRTMRNVSLTVL